MRKFGELVGIAFQIKDDIFDYGSPGNIGKPTGLDIREQKLTLPLIHVLNTVNRQDRRELIHIVKNKFDDSRSIDRAIRMVIDHGGITYAHEKMLAIKDEALTLLNGIPDSNAKRALIGLVEFTTNREK
jgi:octaprenyl-diphosphate synthase